MTRPLLIIPMLAALCGCTRETESPGDPAVRPTRAASTAVFQDVAHASGLDFRHESGHAERFFNPEIMAAGVSLLDADGDGDMDVYALQGGSLDPDDPKPGPNRLFLNRGDGLFEPAAPGHGADDGGFGMGAATGDYDADGDTDLYVTNVGRNTLLRNDGGRFTDVTSVARVPGDGWSTSATFVDYDGDGDLDLFVCNYFRWSADNEYDCREVAGAPDYCGPQAYAAPTPDTLYRNDGNGVFTDVTDESGIGSARGNGLGVAVGDYDDDRDLDIFVANDATPNHLWINEGAGVFVESALQRGCAMDESGAVKAGMGVGSADFDEDGRLDLLVVNLTGETDSLFVNGGGWFAERAASAGLAATSRAFTRFGTGFFDFDNDGTLDIYHANGRVRRLGRMHGDDPYAEPNLLYRGLGDGHFEQIMPRGGTTPPLVHRSRGVAFGDLDDDGGVDIIVANADGPLYVLHNVAASRGHWLTLDVRHRTGGVALGASLRVRFGDRVVRRDVQTAYSYCSASDPRVHVGLGSTETVEEITVHWTDGVTTTHGPFSADRTVDIRR